MSTHVRDTSSSVAATLGWFVALLCAALIALRGGPAGLDGVRALIDGDDAGDLGPKVAGPAFVHAEDEGVDDLGELEAYAREDVAPVPVAMPVEPGGAVAPTTLTPATTTDDDDGDGDATTARTAIEDVCVDGAAGACRRWAMDAAYDALAAAKAGTGLARISLYGDSVTAEGYIASGMRSRMIKKFGDGGAGFVFLAKPSRWYQNLAVRQAESGGWLIHSVVHNLASDRRHGYGGASFTGTAGDVATFRTAKAGAGSKVSRFELYYLASPSGGTAEIVVDGEVARTVDTRSDTTASGFAAIDLTDGPHELKVRVTAGKVRAFGVTMERASGVVIDSLGIVSQTAKNMGNNDAAHYAEQIAHRDPALVMVLLGANESAWLASKRDMKELRQHWDRVLGRIRRGHPGASCLVLGTLDAGRLTEDKKYEGRAAITTMIEVERAAAAAAGCAFWDGRAFMGGEGAARTWYKKRLMSGDFEHLTKQGGQVLGSGIVEALEAGYARRTSR